jgi:hypothetical protein
MPSSHHVKGPASGLSQPPPAANKAPGDAAVPVELSQLEVVFENPLLQARFLPSRKLMWVMRSPQPAESREMLQTLRQAQPIIDRLGSQLMLLDLREGPGRNDASFEAAMLPAIGSLLSRFARSAMLVKTAVGRLQLQRLGRETAMPMSVFHDEQEALRFLLE